MDTYLCIQGHSFGLQHTYLNIFSEITQLFELKFHMEHTGKCICGFAGIYAYCRYFIDRMCSGRYWC